MFAFFFIRLSSCMTLSSVYLVVGLFCFGVFSNREKIALTFPHRVKFIHFCKQTDSPGE